MLHHYRAKMFSPVEAVESLFRRINRLNPELNAFVTLNREAALEQAEVSERNFARGTARPLEGVPVAIKDLTHTKGLRTTFGCLVYKDYIPSRDAAVVKRLKKAGAVIMGKTNTPEFGHKGTTDNRLFGPSKNPWKVSNGTGGSSGGSAAAVAAGFCPLAEGSDGGGSIRIPSSLCGVFGFKPSFGRVPSDDHPDDAFAHSVPFVSHGPIARTVSDAALMFDVIQGASDNDPYSLDPLYLSARQMLNRHKTDYRVGYTLDFGIYEVDAEIRDIFMGVLEKLRRHGAIVVPADVRMGKDLQQYVHFFNRLWMIGLAAGTKELMAEHREELSGTLISMIHRGEGASADEYIEMNRYRSYVWQMFQGLFQKFDVLISPTLAAADYAYDREGPETVNGHRIDPESDWMMTSPINLTGQPACSLPAGFTASGIPVGIQCIARKLNDIGLMQFAEWAQSVLKTNTLSSLNY
ncbi:amidase [Sporolactobacillus sp. CQH2019]|uniref:amidase n=1 Tax=Sporolactobacillus sp. CQH2019 TaxID=3023512 RepID=UPI002367FA86|nr:amidase [Sporolactobacillus sp. CQH2019]MDD9148527.1 amidase [Sporolactobacillus sp. CQH2019]